MGEYGATPPAGCPDGHLQAAPALVGNDDETSSLRHDFATSVDLLWILERLEIEALTADETEDVVVCWRSVVRLDVITDELTDVRGNGTEVRDAGYLPPDIEPTDLPTKFVTEIETTIS